MVWCWKSEDHEEFSPWRPSCYRQTNRHHTSMGPVCRHLRVSSIQGHDEGAPRALLELVAVLALSQAEQEMASILLALAFVHRVGHGPKEVRSPRVADQGILALSLLQTGQPLDDRTWLSALTIRTRCAPVSP